MKKIEIKKIYPASMFKSSLYMSALPLAIIAFIGLIITIIGAALQNEILLTIGLPYLGFPIVMLFVSGFINMLMAFIYNFFSRKFGGLELEIAEKNEEE